MDYTPEPSKGTRKFNKLSDGGESNDGVQPGYGESYVMVPVVTREQQDKVVERMVAQKRLKIYRPERG